VSQLAFSNPPQLWFDNVFSTKQKNINNNKQQLVLSCPLAADQGGFMSCSHNTQNGGGGSK